MDVQGHLVNDRFLLDAPIGEAVVSESFRAFDQALDRPVVFHVLRPELTADRGFLDASVSRSPPRRTSRTRT